MLQSIRQLKLFCHIIINRFIQDGCFARAAGLSYTTLLAIAPVLALAFAVLSMFPVFQGMEARIQEIIFQTFVPATSGTIGNYFTRFIGNATHSTAFGVISLAITSLLLLLTIQTAFDSIWKSASKRTFISNILTFWATLTMGPLLIGTSLSLSSYVFAKAKILNIPGAIEANWLFLRIFPSMMEGIAFFLLYSVVPNTFVRWKHAIIGAAFTTVVFEVLKLTFAYYIANFPFYEVLYGTLATVPILLIWLYLSWAAALLGAEIVAALPEYSTLNNTDTKFEQNDFSSTRILLAALIIIHRLYLASHRMNQNETHRSLINGIAMRHAVIHEALKRLQQTYYVLKTEDGKFVLNRELDSVSVLTFAQDLGAYPVSSQINDKLGDCASFLKDYLECQNLNWQDCKELSIKQIFSPINTE